MKHRFLISVLVLIFFLLWFLRSRCTEELTDSVLLYHFLNFSATIKSFTFKHLIMANVFLNAFSQMGVRSAAYSLNPRRAPPWSMGFWWEPCEQWVNLSIEIHLKLDERSVQLPLCKVNEKHPESGQICREHHWSWPTLSVISEIKGRRREGNLFIVSRKSAKGNSSLQAVFEKPKGKSMED